MYVQTVPSRHCAGQHLQVFVIIHTQDLWLLLGIVPTKATYMRAVASRHYAGRHFLDFMNICMCGSIW